MDSKKPLPKFRHPPLTEVVHGVQFDRLRWTVVHPGQFYGRVRSEFPTVRTVPTLPPLQGIAGQAPPVPAIQFADPNEVPRAWFIDETEAYLLQVQADRFLFNWRSEPGHGEYPHFEDVHSRFNAAFREFEAFADDEGLGPVNPHLCEMSYINHIPLADRDGRLRGPQELLTIGGEMHGPEWAASADATNFTAHYILRRTDDVQYGRLTATLAHVTRQPSNERAILLDLTLHGSPSLGGFGSIQAFHVAAHEIILNYFASVTTQLAHEEWGLIQ
jgi:uncharacterized protein (TIGR04255 family)